MARTAPAGDDQVAAAMRESLLLFIAHLKQDPMQTALRMRALQAMSEGVSLDILQPIVEADAKARSTGVLDERLSAFLRARATFTAACRKFNADAG